jgi:hypothetical protein
MECGSDRVKRWNAWQVECHACGAARIATLDAPATVVRHCANARCAAPLEPGTWYATHKLYRGRDEVTVRYCERCALAPCSTSRAYRVEQRCERRTRSHAGRRQGQRALAREAPARSGDVATRLHAVERRARRSGYALVDGVWKKVV